MAWSTPKDRLPVAEAAAAVGVSARRMRRLVADGLVAGERDGQGYWSVRRESLAAWNAGRLPAVRPLGEQSLRLLADVLALRLGAPISEALRAGSARDRHRAENRADRLAVADEPALLLRAWSRSRPRAQMLHLAIDGAAEILDVPGVAPAGISHPLSRLAAVGEVEVVADDVAVGRLAEMSSGPFRVLVRPSMADRSLGDVVFDLADHRDARADGEIARLVAA